jgi:hypothetical protein
MRRCAHQFNGRGSLTNRVYCTLCGEWAQPGSAPAAWWQRVLVPPYLVLFALLYGAVGGFASTLKRAPELVIGPKEDPQTTRWLIFKTSGWQMCLHRWHRSDHDRALHDHSGDSWSLILLGHYTEVFSHRWERMRSRLVWPFRVVYRRGETPHRVVIHDGLRGQVLTLWFRMPPRREWGFHCPRGWKHNSDYISDRGYYGTKSSVIGKGCDG